jgi:F-type H+-transporting ATPase subunit c
MLHAMLALAQEAGGSMTSDAARNFLALMGAGIGAGLVPLGVGLGIGRIGGSVAEGIARQPEAGGTIQTSGIILAALIEGVGLFGLVITLLVWLKVA